MSELAIDDLLSCACFNTRNAARVVTQHYDKALAPSGLRITQFAILSVVRVRGAVRMQALAQTLGLDPSTLSRTLQPLENEGWLRVEEGEDRRSREVVLTAAGHRVLEQASDLWLSARSKLADKVGEKRISRLVKDLMHVQTSLRSRSSPAHRLRPVQP